MLKDLVSKCRTYRRFYEDYEVSCETLRELVDLARLTASAGNNQPLRYILSCTKEKNALIFPNLAWAKYLENWPGPEEGERPSAYIVMVADKKAPALYYNWDAGITSWMMMLGAAEKGLGGCIIASVNKANLAKVLNIPDEYEVVFVLAIGKPKEEVVIDRIPESGDIRYWRDEKQVHHVPKRTLDEIILKL